MSKSVRRLFETFAPEHYELELAPDRDDMTFTGKVSLTGLKKGRPSQRLTLHQKGLTITKAALVAHTQTGKKTIPVDRINSQKSFDELRLHTKESLRPGKYTVTLSFHGSITKPMSGIYPCDFTYKNKPKKLIATQFESHHAREVFPCIDEPEAKATFDLTLTTPANEPVIANTPVKKMIKKGARQVTCFETTPKMSTYLLAFVFGEMGYLEAKTKHGVTIRTYATPDNVALTKFALDFAVKCLDFYNDYFHIPYPLEKCDLVALPDFAAGAMENWGCITFREQTLLVDPKNTSLPMKQYVAMVVAHELAHQWFGNLVTMRWWTDLWLNEGFASWIEYLAVDKIFPKWDMWTQFVVDELQTAFKLDALENTHAVEVPVHHPDEIRTIFDAISYNKGSSLIHMLHTYLTPTVFQDGLCHYLKKHRYGNTDTVDLWQALEEVSKKPVRHFMHSWTSLPGHPVVHVEVEKNKAELKQERFLVNPESQSKQSKTVWPIAVLSTDTKAPDLFETKQTSFAVANAKNFKLNMGQSAFYHAIYDRSHLERLGELVQTKQLGPLERLGILSDAFEAAKAGYSSTLDALQLLPYYADEDNAAVWDVIAANILSIRAVLADETVRDMMKPFLRQLIQKQYKRLGWNEKKSDSHFDKLLRITVLGMASLGEEPSVIAKIKQLYKQAKSPADIPPDLRGLVYNTMARLGGSDEFKTFVTWHNEATLSEDQNTLTAAITGFKQPNLIKQSLAMIDSKHVRHQDIAYWVAFSFMNRYAKADTWAWMTKHWDWLDASLGGDLSFYRFPVYAARAFFDTAFLKQYRQFFEPRLTPAFDRSFKQGIEIIEWQAAWQKRDAEAVKQFFKDYH